MLGRAQRFVDLKQGSSAFMFLVRAPTQGRNGGSAHQGAVSRNPLFPTSTPEAGAGAHISKSIKSSPPPFYYMQPIFPLAIVFSCRSTPVSYSPLLFLASKLFLVPSYTWDGGGEAVSYFKKTFKLQAPKLCCVFCLHITGNNCYLNVRLPPPSKKRY